jgi:hypothetical protein
MRAYLKDECDDLGLVLMVDIHPPTDKMQRGRKGNKSLDPRPIMRRSPMESQFLDDICDWLVLADRMNDQPLAGRFNTVYKKDKAVTKKMLTALLKQSATAVGLPADRSLPSPSESVGLLLWPPRMMLVMRRLTTEGVGFLVRLYVNSITSVEYRVGVPWRLVDAVTVPPR